MRRTDLQRLLCCGVLLFTVFGAGCFCPLSGLGRTIRLGLMHALSEYTAVVVHQGRYVILQFRMDTAAVATQPSQYRDYQALAWVRRRMAEEHARTAGRSDLPHEDEWIAGIQGTTMWPHTTGGQPKADDERALEYEREWLVVSKPISQLEADLAKLSWTQGRLCFVLPGSPADAYEVEEVKAILKKHGVNCDWSPWSQSAEPSKPSDQGVWQTVVKGAGTRPQVQGRP